MITSPSDVDNYWKIRQINSIELEEFTYRDKFGPKWTKFGKETETQQLVNQGL